MDGLTGAAFARKYGIQPCAVNRAKKQKKLRTYEDGSIIPTEPANIQWGIRAQGISLRRKKELAIKAGHIEPEKKEPDIPDEVLENFDISQIDSDTMEQLWANFNAIPRDLADKLKVVEQVKALQIKSDEYRKNLISKDLVARVFSHWYMIEMNEFMPLADRLATESAAICGVDDLDTIKKIRDINQTEFYKVLKHVQRMVNEFLNNVDSEPIGDVVTSDKGDNNGGVE